MLNLYDALIEVNHYFLLDKIKCKKQVIGRFKNYG